MRLKIYQLMVFCYLIILFLLLLSDCMAVAIKKVSISFPPPKPFNIRVSNIQVINNQIIIIVPIGIDK